MKILVIKFRHIGDVLLSTPLIHNLRIHYPDARIDVAVNDDTLPMLQNNPDIDTLLPYPRKNREKGLFNRIAQELRYLKKLQTPGYDLVINLTEGERGAYITLLSGARQTIGFRPTKGWMRLFSPYTLHADRMKIFEHAVNHDLQIVPLLGGEIVSRKVSIFWTSEEKERIDRILKEEGIDRYVHVHPVSRWMFKCWEDDRMAEIIDYIQEEKGIPVVITAAPDPVERKRVDSILSLCRSRPLDLGGELSLNELAALSERAELFFGVDTAPMHMAAAVDTPVVALFGASRPDIWGPWDNTMEKTEFTYTNGIQHSGRHTVVSHTDHSTFYENGIKKSRGMRKIITSDVKRVIDDKI